MTDDHHTSSVSRSDLIKIVVVRLPVFFLALCAMFFLPAGTLVYWEAWLYLIILFFLMAFASAYLIINDPRLMERRLTYKEKNAHQSKIITLSVIFFLISFLIPGFDQRFGWSAVSAGVIIAADTIVLLGYGIVLLVFRENTYTARVIDVEQEQKVITSGPYAIVRHPMYLGTIFIYVFSPLALGSYWAMIPTIFLLAVIIARIKNEELVLERDLQGYRAYMQATRYRLIPGVW